MTGALESAQKQRGTAGGALVIGLVTSLYGASGAFGAVGRGAQHDLARRGGRGFVKHKAHEPRCGRSLLIVLALVTFVLLFLGGGLADDVLGMIGLGRQRRDGLARRCAGRRRCWWR